MKVRNRILIAVAVIALVALYYYVTIPAINIHSSETWFYVIFIVLIAGVIYVVRSRTQINLSELRTNNILKVFLGIIAAIALVFIIGSVLSSPIVNAMKYQQLMPVEEGEFSEEVEELSFDKVPLLDKDTAALLGDRKMGNMVDMVSQFEADDIYSQINYQGNPVRVTPLKYGNLIKWLPTCGREFPPTLPSTWRTRQPRW